MTFHNISQEDLRPSRRANIRALLGKLFGFEGRMRGFTLHLGDDSCWWIAACPRTSFLAEKLAAIMHLQAEEPVDPHVMIFCEKKADQLKADPLPWQAQGWVNLNHYFLHIWFHPGSPDVLCQYDPANPNSCYGLLCDALSFIHRESTRRGGLPFHAALLEHRGQGVVLAAPGDTGKTTCSRRVLPPWQACCDDEALVVLSPEGRYLAHPFPTWSDYIWERDENTWKVESAVPLAGIFFLEQSPEDGYVALGGAQAAVAATSSAEQVMARFLRWCDAGEARELRRTMFANACTLVRQVPAFRLRVSLTGSFWEKIETALGWT